MALENKDKPKSSKKDKLSSALKKEVASSGLSGFVRDVKKNKGKAKPPEDELSTAQADDSAYLVDNHDSGRLKMGFKLKKILIIAAGLLLLVYLYNTLLGGGIHKQAVYLSSQPIDTSRLASLKATLPTFSIDRPIYVHFAMGSELKLNTIRIQVVHTVSGVEHTVGEISATVKPEWKHIQTHFQEEFFEKPGQYKIKIFKPDGGLLSEQKFQVRN